MLLFLSLHSPFPTNRCTWCIMVLLLDVVG